MDSVQDGKAVFVFDTPVGLSSEFFQATIFKVFNLCNALCELDVTSILSKCLTIAQARYNINIGKFNYGKSENA